MSYDNPTGTSTDPQGSTKDTAKDQASSVAGSAKQSGQQLAGEAKHEAAEVGREAGRQAKDVLRQGRSQLSEQASQQQQKAAGNLRSVGEELSSMARSTEQQGLAADLASQAGDRVTAVAGWLESREPADLLQEVKTFARNRPGTFLAIAATAGLIAGRITRGAKDVTSDDGGSTGGAPRRSSAYGTGSTSGTGTTYGTGAVYGGAAAPVAGTAGGAPTSGVQGDALGTSYRTGGADADAYTTDTYGSDTRDDAYTPDTYGTGTENPEGTGTVPETGGGVYGGGTGEVPERGEQATWPPLNDEREKR